MRAALRYAVLVAMTACVGAYIVAAGFQVTR